MIKRGDILLANLDPIVGSEQGGTRPVLVIQNNLLNEHSPTILIAAITSKKFNNEYPTNVFLLKSDSRLNRDSTVMLNQIRMIDRKRLIKKLGFLDSFLMNKVDSAI